MNYNHKQMNTNNYKTCLARVLWEFNIIPSQTHSCRTQYLTEPLHSHPPQLQVPVSAHQLTPSCPSTRLHKGNAPVPSLPRRDHMTPPSVPSALARRRLAEQKQHRLRLWCDFRRHSGPRRRHRLPRSYVPYDPLWM